MKKTAKKQQRKASKKVGKKPVNKLFYLLGILVLTVLVYANSINNDFIYQFDDDLYVTNNVDIQEFSFENIKTVFSKSYVGLYLPLTMMTYMVEYSLYELNPVPYHLLNLLLHLINTVLLFFLIYKIKPNVYIASLVAFVFAVHPMHVEAVAWISERKEVLYTFFYLFGLLAYLNFLKERSLKFYLLTIGFFILSLLSKTIAVSFPLVILALDWYSGRKLLSKQLVLEKIPFFALSLAFGLLGVYFTSTVADTSTPDIQLLYRPFIVGDAMLIYLYKFIAPFRLMIYYYYPDVTSAALPLKFYFSTIILLVVVAAGIYGIVKAKAKQRDLILGLLLFVIPTLFILQLIPAGRAYATERYTYLSYVGLAYILGILTVDLVQSRNPKFISIRATIIGGLAFFAMGISYLTVDRNKDWKDSFTLFTDLIQKMPEHTHPYLIRGITHYQFGSHQLALADYDKSIELDPNNLKALSNRSSVRGMTGDLDGSLQDANRALDIDSEYTNALNNRATALFFKEDYEAAIADYTSLITLDSLNPDHYRKRIMVQEKLKEWDAILLDYSSLFQLEPGNHLNFAKAGEIYYKLDDLDKAIEYLSLSMKVNPNYFQPLFLRGNAFYKLGEYAKALSDFQRYAKVTNESNAYYNAGMCFKMLRQIPEACSQWQTALDLGHKDASKRMKESCQ